MAKRALIPVALLGLIASQMLVAVGAVSAAGPAFTIMADQPPTAAPKGHNWAFNDFFPRAVTVTTGTTIAFQLAPSPNAFHTATLLPAGMTAAQDLIASGGISADAEDTTRNPQGQSHTQLSLPALFPAPASGCGTADKPCTFDGTSVVSSGAPLAGPMPAFNVTITAPVGTYTFHCRIHPLMEGTINVVSAGSSGMTTADSAAADAAAQTTADVAAAKAVEATYAKAAVKTNADGTHTWTIAAGASTADGHVDLLEFLPWSLHVRKGDRVMWAPKAINEPHTVTFPTDLHTDMVPMCEGSGGTDTPATPTKNPPTGPQDFACGSGPADEIEFVPGGGSRTLLSGKTVSDSGLIAMPSEVAAFGLPTTAARYSWSVRISPKASSGRYHYVCQIHAGMAAVLTVSGG